jgi:uncharacterized protein YecA (UPF0149 family)
MHDSVLIRLTKHEAIALLSFLARFRDLDELSLKSEADRQILYDLCAMVQNELVTELTSEKWNELLAQAQAAIVAGEE